MLSNILLCIDIMRRLPLFRYNNKQAEQLPSNKNTSPLKDQSPYTPQRNIKVLEQQNKKLMKLYHSQSPPINNSLAILESPKQRYSPYNNLSVNLSDNTLPPIKQVSKKPRYYMQSLVKALTTSQNTYIMKLFREHFEDSITAFQASKGIKIESKKKSFLSTKPVKSKTIVLDLDQTLVHCSQLLQHPMVKLDIPIQNGMIIKAGVNIRPHCKDFLKNLSQIAQVVIFTASNPLYADTVLNHLDPEGKWISHRLYRQHCTQQKGYHIKDLRNLNRRLQDTLIVDNSAYSYILQPDNGVPIIPFFDNNKDRELLHLFEYLKEVLLQEDVREMNEKHFMLRRYTDSDVKNLLLKN